MFVSKSSGQRAPRFAAAAFLTAALTLSACARPASQQKAPFHADALIAAWVEMWNRYDLAQVRTLFLADSSVTYFSSEKEGLIVGIDAVEQHHAGFGFVPGGKPPQNRLWVENLHAQLFWPAAVVTGTWYFQRQGVAAAQRGPFTFVYVQRGAEYRIAHAQFGNYK